MGGLSLERLRQIHIFFPIIAYNHTANTEFFSAILETFLQFTRFNFKFSYHFLVTESLINRARNTCIMQFLKNEEATHLCFIDSDVVFHWTQILALLEKLEEFNLGIIGGSYPIKKVHFDRLRKNPLLPEECLTGHPCSGKMRGNSDILECEHIATGFMMFSREMILKVIDDNKDVPNFFYRNDVDGYCESPLPNKKYANLFQLYVHPIYNTLLSEDYSFCKLVQASGYKTCIIPNLSLIHMGWFPYKGNFAQKQLFWDSKQEGADCKLFNEKDPEQVAAYNKMMEEQLAELKGDRGSGNKSQEEIKEDAV